MFQDQNDDREAQMLLDLDKAFNELQYAIKKFDIPHQVKLIASSWLWQVVIFRVASTIELNL